MQCQQFTRKNQQCKRKAKYKDKPLKHWHYLCRQHYFMRIKYYKKYGYHYKILLLENE